MLNVQSNTNKEQENNQSEELSLEVQKSNSREQYNDHCGHSKVTTKQAYTYKIIIVIFYSLFTYH